MARQSAEPVPDRGSMPDTAASPGALEVELRELESEIVNNDQPISPLLKTVAERIAAITLADGTAIAVCDQWGVICRASTGDAPEVGSRLRPDSALTRECFETGQTVVCQDTETDYRVRRLTAKSLRLRSAVVVPLQRNDSVLGVVEILSSRPYAFDETHVAGLQRIAVLLTAALLPPAPLESAESVVPAPTDAETDAEKDKDQELAPIAPLLMPALDSISDPVADISAPAIPAAGNLVPEKVYPENPALEYHEEQKSRLTPVVLAAVILLLLLLGLFLWFARRSQPGGEHSVPAATPTTEPPPNRTGLESQTSQAGATTVLPPDSGRLAVPKSLAPAEPPSPAPDKPAVPTVTESPAPSPKPAPAASSEPAQVLRPAVPSLMILGVPPGAKVFVDDQLQASSKAAGQTTVPALAAGHHRLQLKVDGYRDYDQSIEVEDGKTSSLTAKLEPLDLPTLAGSGTAPVFAVAPALPAPVVSTHPSPPDFALARTLRAHDGWVTGVAFSPNGQRLVSGSWDGTMKFWEVPSGEPLSTVSGKTKELQALTFSRDGKLLATENSSDTASLRDPATGEEIRTFPSDKALGPVGSNWVYSIAFSPNGRWLASGIDDKTVRLWDVQTGRKIRDLTGQRRPVIYIAFSPDGSLLATGDDEKNIKIWDVSSGAEMYRLQGHKKLVYAVAFSPNGRLLASASGDKTVKLWDLSTGQELRTLSGHTNLVSSLAFSPDGRWLASGSWDKTIRLWDVETGKEIQTLSGHNHPVFSLAFDSRGRWLASGSEDGTIKLWRLADAANSSR
jgi:WD40 repeat protein/cytoskeletal protein RodZ